MRRKLVSTIILFIMVFLVGCNSNKIVIEFDALGGNLVESQTLKKGDLIEIPVISREGYTLDGWYISYINDNGVFEKWLFMSNGVKDDITLYAKWDVNQYNIIFDTNGGVAINSLMVDYNSSFNELPLPEKLGHYFGGWFLDEEFSQKFDLDLMPNYDLTLYAKWFNYNDFEYTLINSEAHITAYNGLEKELIVPDYIDGYPITKLEYGSFTDNEVIEKVILPSGLKVIGSYSFKNAKSLKEIFLPDNVTLIGSYAFSGSKSLTKIHLSDNLTSIGKFAFSECESLESIEIPERVKEIPYGAFYNAKSLKTVSLPEGLTAIRDSAFLNTSALTTINFPNELKTIDYSAFYGASSLKTVIIPSGVTNIGNRAFMNMSSLEEFIVANDNANFKSVDGVLLSKDGKILYNYPIGKSESSYNAPDGVTTINSMAFLGASSLVAISLPADLTLIENAAFSDTSSLEAVNVNFSNSVYQSIDGVLYLKDLSEIVLYPQAKKDSQFYILETVVTIDAGVFYKTSLLTEVIISKNVINISESAFRYNKSLEKITVEADNANYASSDGVLYNKNLSELLQYPEAKKDVEFIIPTSVILIGNGSFSGNNYIEKIVITENVIFIGSWVFNDCTALNYLFIPSNVINFGSNCFSRTDSLKVIYVEVLIQPSGWWDNWNNDIDIIWGYEEE